MLNGVVAGADVSIGGGIDICVRVGTYVGESIGVRIGVALGASVLQTEVVVPTT